MIAAAPDTEHLQLHQARTLADLQAQMRVALARHLGPIAAALLLHDGHDTPARVEIAHGDATVPEGSALDAPPWDPAHTVHVPVTYRGEPLGSLLLARAPSALPPLAELLQHYAVARVNLQLGADTAQSSEVYFASLHAFEEGVGLFQEADRATVGARLLSLLTSIFSTHPGALFTWATPSAGPTGRRLQLDQVLAIPEPLLEPLRRTDGVWCLEDVDTVTPVIARRGAHGEFEVTGTDPGGVDCSAFAGLPPAIDNLVLCPLSFHGLQIGLALVVNASLDSPELTFKLESVRRLGELGAALFHRIHLEDLAVRSREVETQIAIAARIQARLLPTETPELEGIECAFSSQAAAHVGGDYLDLLTDAEGRFYAVVADVSGHGINSALLMTSYRSTCRAEYFRRSPADLLAKLNREVHHESGDTGMFVTGAVLRVDADRRRATFAGAGHTPVLLYRCGSGTLQELDSTGPPNGFVRHTDYETRGLTLAAGDVLLLYTDGIVEAKRDGNDLDMFGEERLRDTLIGVAPGSAAEILGALTSAVSEFAGPGGCDDDVSLLVLKIR